MPPGLQVSIELSQATGGFQVCNLTSGCSGTQNRGDFHVKFDTTAGVLLSSAAERVVDHSLGNLRQFPFSSTSIGSVADYFISLHDFGKKRRTVCFASRAWVPSNATEQRP